MAAKTTKSNTQPTNSIMEKLLASQSQKLMTLHRGQQIEGEVISISDKEVILDLGAKAEGVISLREIPESSRAGLKTGCRLQVFVYLTENEHGQAVLSSSLARLDSERALRSRSFRGGKSRGGKPLDWSRFLTAQNQKSKLQGQVLELNKGGLIVQVTDIRGFLPNSQVGFELLSKAGAGLDKLVGESLTVTVIEVDQKNNKLIFSQRGAISESTRQKLQSFQKDQKTTGKIVAVLPFGLVVDVNGTEGLVFISDVSWDRVEDLTKEFTVGQESEVKVLSVDEDLGRLNLSIKELQEDPFAKLAEKFPADEVVKGEITGLSEAGVVVRLAEGIEGLLPGSRMKAETKYETGQTMTFLVDSVDTHKRRINLAPFVTSTAGLIYK